MTVLLMRTLHWTGANAVPKSKKEGSQLCLSCGVAWFADGTITARTGETSRSTSMESGRVPDWHCWYGSGQSRSGPASASTFLRRGATTVLPRTHFLRTMGGRRIRVPRNATWLLQAAITPALRFSRMKRYNHTYFQTGALKLILIAEMNLEANPQDVLRGALGTHPPHTRAPPEDRGGLRADAPWSRELGGVLEA